MLLVDLEILIADTTIEKHGYKLIVLQTFLQKYFTCSKHCIRIKSTMFCRLTIIHKATVQVEGTIHLSLALITATAIIGLLRA